MKKILKHITLLLLMVLPLEVMAFSTWDGTSTAAWTKGNGTSSAPYIIETAEQLAYLAQQVNAGNSYSGKYFRMDADVDLNGKQWTPIGTESAPFNGIFDGAHHIVYNLYISNDNMDRVGLFGCIVDGGLRSIGVENCNIEVYDHPTRQGMLLTGAVAAFVSSPGTSLEYCYATGRTNVFNDAGDECFPYDNNGHYTMTGGVFGRVENTDIIYCYNAVDMTEGTHRDIGGVVCYGINTNVSFCYNDGDIRGLYCRAGILSWSGANSSSEGNTIRGCYNRGRITTCQPIGGKPDNNNYNGGISACASYTSIYNCYTVGYMDNYSGNSSFAIAANELAWVSLRNSNYHLNTINVNHFDQPRCGQQATRSQLTSTTAPTIIGLSYYRMDFGSNNGYPIHQQNIYNTETCSVERTGELSVMLDASVYAHNRTDKGIAWGLESADPASWTEHSTMDSVLNHFEAKNLQYDVLYGYRAYQTVVTGKVYGKNRYFQISKDTFCEGDEYKFHGKTFATGGDFAVVDGDYTYFLHLDMLPKIEVTLPEVSVCYEYTWEGQTTKQTTVLKTVVKSVLCGCDSTTYQPVTIKDSVVVTLPEVKNCYEYTWEGLTTKKSAKLRKVDVGANGCDSITYQPVIIKDSVVVTLPEVENCYDYEWEGQTTKKDTIFRKVDIGSNGCDSITYQPVIIKDSVVVTLPQVENCYEYTWEGQTTKRSAKLRKVDVGANGCDSITYQPVIIKDSVVVTLPEVENCYEYTWEGQTTKKSAKLRRVDIGVNGCDSITYQPVIIKDSVVVTLPEVENCYEYTWEGQTTKKSAKLRKVDVGVNGCDSITYQPVIIKDSVVVHLPDVEACGEYTWHEMTVKESATLRYETVGSNQCDSITYLYVDISYDTSTAVEDTVKYGHTYQKKGFDLPVQREIGEFVFEKTVHTAKGCDSTVVLTLHVIPDRDLPLKPASYVEYKDGRFNWQIENVENFPNVYVEIYDRFGRRVAMYHGYDNNNGWNGYYNGHILPSTDYWYYIRDDIFGSMSGHFTLYYKQGQW